MARFSSDYHQILNREQNHLKSITLQKIDLNEIACRRLILIDLY